MNFVSEYFMASFNAMKKSQSDVNKLVLLRLFKIINQKTPTDIFCDYVNCQRRAM